MDEQGWIPLAIIANFNRVRMLTPNMMLIVEALKESSLVEVALDSAYVRAKGTWKTWILPPQQVRWPRTVPT
jgi:la-related protein 1